MISWHCFYILSVVVTFLSVADCYYVTLSSNGPVVLGGTITFQADLYNNDGSRPSGRFKYFWEDKSIISNTYEVITTNTTTFYSIQYPAANYTAGSYRIQVVARVLNCIWFNCETSSRLDFQITGLLNGNISVIQSNKTVESKYVSTNVTNVTINLLPADKEFVFNQSHIIDSYWFVDCRFYDKTNDLSHNFNFTKPNVSHIIQVLIVVSEKPPPPPPTTTTTTTTTPIPTTTTTTTSPPSNNTNITTSITKSSTTISIPAYTTTTVKNVVNEVLSTTEKSIIGEKTISEQVVEVLNSTDMAFLALTNNTGNGSCIDPSNIMSDPKKTYGYFEKHIEVRAPISNISLEGSNWIQPWEMLSLNITCNGSGPFSKCLRFIRGKYNITGNETCDSVETLTECKFSINRYFFEPNIYTILMFLKNDIGTTVYPLTINIYKVDKKPQLSVIVVPVSCSLAAVVLIVFGVAYYIQNRARFNVEVANFDFGKNNPDMEYKTFMERLRDSFNSSIRPGGEGISGYKPLSNPEILQ